DESGRETAQHTHAHCGHLGSRCRPPRVPPRTLARTRLQGRERSRVGRGIRCVVGDLRRGPRLGNRRHALIAFRHEETGFMSAWDLLSHEDLHIDLPGDDWIPLRVAALIANVPLKAMRRNADRGNIRTHKWYD